MIMTTLEYLEIQKELLTIDYQSNVNQYHRMVILKKLEYINSKIEKELEFINTSTEQNLTDI